MTDVEVSEKYYDTVVLGAGISGLVAASTVLRGTVGTVLVVDGYDMIGGNHLHRAIGPYTFDIGSFIFQDDSPLIEHFPELLDHYVVIEPSWAKLTPRGAIAPYPFSVKHDVFAGGWLETFLIVASALRSRLRRSGPSQARAFASHWLGERFLVSSGLEYYMERLCGRPAEEIDLAFAHSRMMWIPEHASWKGILRTFRHYLPGWRGRSDAGPPTRQMARPRGGFPELYAPVRRRLEGMGATFVLGRQPDAIRRHGAIFDIEMDGCRISTGRVLSTLPIEITLQMCGIDSEEFLPTATLISLFYSFDGSRGFGESILYNFTPSGRWKRLTMYSDFYGPAGGREYFAVEVVAGAEGQTVAEAAREFAGHVERHRLFRGDLRFEGGNVQTSAYPIFTRGSAARATRLRTRLLQVGVESFGRQGGFEYQSTARVSTHAAERAVSRR